MISFSSLGQRSRLGNHLFQYAFLRSTAERLGTAFYCPPWEGDQIFCLDDEATRASSPSGILFKHVEPANFTGLDSDAFEIKDHTEISGYFQTEQYFAPSNVRKWYRFREEKIAPIRDRFSGIDFGNCVCLHVRLGDFLSTYWDNYYAPTPDYYRRALRLIPQGRQVLVFSDDIAGAKVYLAGVVRNPIFIEGEQPFEGIYLQSLCRDFICSPSTFSWWGAWLGAHPDKVVIVPKEGPFRPGAPLQNLEFWPETWLRVRGLHPLLDHRRSVQFKHFVTRCGNKVLRLVGWNH